MAQQAALTTERHVAELNARLDRLPRWGLSPLLFVVVGASYFFTFYDITAIGVTLPTLTPAFHLSGADEALPVTANLFAYMLGAYGLGTVADYVGRRRALMLSVAILTLGGVLTALSWNLASLTAFRFVVGIGMGAQIALAATIMTELAPPGMRGRAVALNVFWGGVGLAAATWVGIGLLQLGPVGWRLVFAVGALTVFLLLFLNDRWVPESPRWLVLHGRGEEADALMARMEDRVRRAGVDLPPPRDVSAEAALGRFPTAELFRGPYLGRLVVVFAFWFFTYMASYAYLAYQPTLLIQMGGSAPHGLLYTALGDVAFPVGALLAVLLIDRWNRKYLAAGAGAVGILGIAIVALSQGPAAIVVGSFIAGIWILSPAYGYAYTSEVFPTRARASAMSIGDGLGHLGGAVQPYIVVAALGALGARATFWVIAGMLAVGALVILLGGMRTAGESLTEMAR